MNGWMRCNRWLFGLLVAAGTIAHAGRGNAQILMRPPIPDAEVLQTQSFQLAGDAIRLAQFGQIDEAFRRVELAAQITPNSAEVLVVLGTLHLQQEEYAKAISTLNRARTITPDDPDILIALGSAHVRQGSYFAALDALERGLEQQPDNMQALFDLGNAHLLLENYDKARDTYERALDVDAEFWPAINNIGLVDYQTGRIDDAIARWRQSIELDERAAEPKLALATALYIQGNTEEALNLGASAMQLDATYGEVETLRDNLWGDRLITDVQILLSTDEVSNALNQARAESASTDLDANF
ncbi:MAG: tetratricopeptide repeat protein [Cyanobacteria bacterium J06639_1]